MRTLLVSAAALCVFAAPAFAQAPLPLSKILTTVEAGGTRVIVSAEKERRGWEVISYPAGSRACREDRIDPATGAVIRAERERKYSLPPADAKSASAIAAQIEALGVGPVTKLEFDDRVWEVKVRDGKRRAEFKLDPKTGATKRCEGRLCPR